MLFRGMTAFRWGHKPIVKDPVVLFTRVGEFVLVSGKNNCLDNYILFPLVSSNALAGDNIPHSVQNHPIELPLSRCHLPLPLGSHFSAGRRAVCVSAALISGVGNILLDLEAIHALERADPGLRVG